MNGHKLQSIKVQSVAVVLHPSSDEPVLLYLGEQQEAIGCEVCGVPFDEATKLPCPKEVKLQVVSDG